VTVERFIPPRPAPAPEFVGPPGAQEDVSALSDRALLVRMANAVFCLEHQVGGIARELADVRRQQRRSGRWQEHAEDEITAVRDLRKLVKTWRSRALAGAGAVLIAVATAYVLIKLGLKVP
jgi:hypothetical protein